MHGYPYAEPMFDITGVKKNESLMIIALILGILEISAYLSSNKAFEMLSLSNIYYDAVSETTKTIFLSTGQSMLSTWKGTAFDIYYVLNGIALIIISCVMFKSTIYSKNTAAIGLSSGCLMMIPSDSRYYWAYFLTCFIYSMDIVCNTGCN